MLVLLGFGMISTFMLLIMSKRLTPVAALIVVPLLFGLLSGRGAELAPAILASLKAVAPTACLLFFAIIFFGLMIDVGMFDPLIRLILRVVHHDPVRLALGTALLTSIVSLDGDGSTTFIIVTSAFLPLYLRVGMSPWVLTCIAATANGVLNTVPWGGSTVRAAAALNVSPVDIFVAMIPSIGAGLAALLLLAWALGRQERRRLARAAPSGHPSPSGHASPPPGPSHDLDVMASATGGLLLHRPHARPRLTWLNALLTLALMGLLVQGQFPPSLVFMVGVSVAAMLNFPQFTQQAEQIKAHATSIVGVVGMVFAATVLTGVLSGSGMVDAMARWLVTVIPESWGPHLAVLTGLISIPMTFFTSNDAFYFGVLPILSQTASHYGISPVEMARAALVGQPLHQSSPLAPSFLLLIGLAQVELGEHAVHTLWRAVGIGLVMLLVGAATAAFPW